MLFQVTANTSPGIRCKNVTDTSDDGDDSDGNTTSDATIVNTQSSGAMEVTKTASVVDTNGNGNNDQGDVIVYTIAVANTGSVTLSGLALTDTLTDGSGGSLSLASGPTFTSNSASSAEGSLAVGEISTYTATYTISQNVANTGSVNNSVSATASTPGNSNDVTDVSDDGDDSDGNTANDVTVVLTSSDSSIEVTKTAVVNDTNGNSKTDQGDVIVYNITVRNTGNITLSSITVSDTLTDGNGGSLSLDIGPSFVSNSGSSAQGTLISGEIATYTATYTISAAAENTPSINNTAQATASTPGNTNDVSDVSDNGNDGDGNTSNDPTVVNITASPQMEVTKEGTVTDNGDGVLGVGDTVNYTIKIENQGNVNITEPSLVDTFTDALSNTLALTSGPTFDFGDLGSSEGTIKPNETAHYGATFVITQGVVDAGGLINSVTVTASSTGNPGGLSDVSDDGDDTDGNTTNDTTVLVINPNPIIETTKTAVIVDNNSNGINDLGDTITYTITVENKGNVSLTGLGLVDTLTDGNGSSLSLLSGPTFVSSSASSAAGSLAVSEIATYTATYTVTQQGLDSGSIVNTVLATASSPANSNDVSDRSDNGDDSDGETQDDNTVVTLTRTSLVESTKTATVTDNNSNGSTDLGDTIVYTITVENKGNVTLSSIGLTDTLLDGDGSALSLSSGPVFTSASASSAQGTLLVGETASYTASYTITQLALDTGSISNSVLVTGSSPGQSNNVTDTSDDGDDSDGNTEDDTTDITISNTPSLEVTKTAAITDNGDGAVGKGDVVQYTISVINNGNVTLSSLSVADILSDASGNTLSLNSGPSFSGSSQGSAQGTLKVGETASYNALYIINQAAVDAGGLSNQASATASSPGNSNDVTDMSDDGDDSDGNTTDDPTVTTITTSSSLEVTKTAAVTDNGGDGNTGSGDIINYTITVENKGNVTLSGLTLVDTLTDGSGGSLTLTNGPSFSSTTLGSSPGTLKPNEVATYSGYYIISANAALTSSINNSVLATASSPGQSNNVTDTSDDGDDSDGNTTDDVTAVSITPLPAIEATKTAVTTDNNSNGIVDLGDTIVYTITVENKGNTSLSSLTLADTLSDGSGGSLTLTSGPTFTSASAGSSQGTLTLGETATYTASYVVSSSAAYTGFISNTVLATASSPGNTDDVTDTSDDGDDTDSNTTNDPTVVNITASPGIEATKTATVTDNGDGVLGKGDIVRYDIKLTNTGNINLQNISIFDQFLSNAGSSLNLISGPSFSGSSLGSAAGNLKPNEIANYIAYYIIEQDVVDAGGFTNQVIASATSNDGNVSDISDDDDDTDGNLVNDPTLISITPTPSIEATKISQVTDNGNGLTGVGDVINYVITIKNTGNVSLSNVTITDILNDGNGNSLTLSNGPTFGGSSQNSINGRLIPGETATYNAYLIVNQNQVNTGLVSNTVNVVASSPGQTNNISDQSDNGNDTDGNVLDDATINQFDINSSLEITKIASIVDANSNAQNDLGDSIVYTITVENTGNVALSNLVLIDVLKDGNNNTLNYTQSISFNSSSLGSSSGNLKVNEIATYTATYTIDQSNVDSGRIKNSVSAVASDPLNSSSVSDLSDDGIDSDGNITNDITETLIYQNPIIKVVKSASVVDINSNSSNDSGDVIVYNITIENTGNVSLSNLTLVDNLTDGDGNALALSEGPVFTSSSASSAQGSLLVGEIATYTASYTISQLAANSESINNSVQAIASSPGNSNNVFDISDDGDDSDGNTTNDSTVVVTTSGGSIEVTKTAVVSDNGDGTNGGGDTINYTITIENIGGQSITGITLVDNLTDNNGNTLTLDLGPNFLSSSQGSVQGTLLAGEIATYSASFVITGASADSGLIQNSVVVTGSSPGNTNDITDTSDDGNDTDGNTTDDPTVVYTSLAPAIEVTKTATVADNGDGVNGAGDTINYLISIVNTGNVTITSLNLVDTITDGNGTSLTLTSGPSFVSNSNNSSQGSIISNETAIYSASYIISSSAALTSQIQNTVTVTGSSPGNLNDVSDVSDNGNDSDGNTTNDPTLVLIADLKSMEVTKIATVADNGDGVNGVGDTINYVITIKNNGNVTINSLSLTDILTDGNGNALILTSNPTFISNSNGSNQGSIIAGETSTYNASFLITENTVNSGSVNNSVTVIGSSPGNSNDVSDISDDGDDTDGNTSNDPTVVSFNINSSIEATKTAYTIDNGDGSINAGDTIVYTITINNTGSTQLSSITLIDTLKDGNNNVLQLSSGPLFVSSTQGSSQGSLNPSESGTYSATYIISNNDAGTGKVINTVTVNASSPGNNNDVTDISDDGDDSDGNTTNDPTIIEIISLPEIEATKVASIVDLNQNGINDVGDRIDYIITIENKGNITVSGLGYIDTLSDASGRELILTTQPTFGSSSQNSPEGILAPSETANYTATYLIGQRAADSGVIRNSIVFRGNSPGKVGDVFDISDDGDDIDGNTADDPTEIFTVSNVGMEVTKTAEITDNGDIEIGAGDIITYNISVENKGNSTLSDLLIIDSLTDGNGNTLTLSNGPFFSGSSEGSPEGVLIKGETATYIAFYIIDAIDVASGIIINTVEASATGPNQNIRITDISDDGDDTDGNSLDDPTEVLLQEIPAIEITKTASITNNTDGIVDAGDLISYDILIENTGNTLLKNIVLEDTMTDGNDGILSLTNGPFFTGSTLGSLEGSLKIGEIASYIAFYNIELSAAETGRIINSANASAQNLEGSLYIEDTSDNGDDTDGNTTDDPTVILISPTPSLEVTKTASLTNNSDYMSPGDEIIFTISVENTGNVNIIDLVIDDVMTDGNGSSIYLTRSPYEVSATNGSSQNLISPGGVIVFNANYLVTQSDIYSGFIENIARVSGTSINYNDPIFDLSDNGDDTDGNTLDDSTIIKLESDYTPKLEVYELVTPNGDQKNDYLIIRGIEDYPDNILRIYNRWGVLVFESNGYPGPGNSEIFTGYSNGRITISKDEKLSSGTYYYVLTFPSNNNPGKSEYVGYLYLQNDLQNE